MISNRITITDPDEELLKYCFSHLRLRNPEYEKKRRMGFYTGNIPEYLYLYEKNGNALSLPYGCLKVLAEQFLDQTFDVIQQDFRNPTEVSFDCTVPLYDYQQEAVDAVSQVYCGILQSPAGSGKTQMGIALAAKLGRKTLWLTHTKDLLLQSKQRAEQYMDPKLMGTITEGRIQIGTGITFATVQTLSSIDLPLFRNEWDVIIVDECHHVAGTPAAVTQFSRVLNNLAARHKYGLSATVHRADGLITATYALLGEVAHIVPDEAVKDRIMKVSVLPRATGTVISRECLDTDGTIIYTKLISHLTQNRDRNQLIVDDIIREASEGHSHLILSERLDHLEELMHRLPPEYRRNSSMVSGKMTSKKAKRERDEAIQDMRSGKKQFLFATYALAKEGLDIPRLDRLYLATPQKDFAVITQSIGRIARTFDGKGKPVCFDYVDNIKSLVKAYKRRCTTYRKAGCQFIEEVDLRVMIPTGNEVT